VPVPWNGTAAPYGFCPPGVPPWLPQPADWAALTVAAQDTDAFSTLVLHRGALAVRRALPSLGAGELRWRNGLPGGVLAFDRPGSPRLTCVANTAPAPVELALAGRLVLTSAPVRYDGTTLVLPPDTASWLATDG
jgi:alpha-glucosidase